MRIVCSRKYPQFAAGIFLHVQGQNHDQATLLPERLDDLIGDGNAVRLIDAFVDSLDLKAPGFARILCNNTGSTSFNSGNTFPSLFDTMGRTYSINLKVTF